MLINFDAIAEEYCSTFSDDEEWNSYSDEITVIDNE